MDRKTQILEDEHQLSKDKKAFDKVNDEIDETINGL